MPSGFQRPTAKGHLCVVIEFDHQAQTDLLRLPKGDTVALASGWLYPHGQTIMATPGPV